MLSIYDSKLLQVLLPSFFIILIFYPVDNNVTSMGSTLGVLVFSAVLLLKSTQGQTTTATDTNATNILPNTTCSGEWSDWSECFPGTQSNPIPYKDRIFILSPSQYEAAACKTMHTVNSIETESCSTSAQPIQDLETVGCKEGEYQCINFKCIPEGLLCNGDDDCDDNSDEYPTNSSGCPLMEKKLVCGLSQEPSSSSIGPIGERYLTGIPGIEEFAAGFDILTGKFKSSALSMAGHGSCRRVLIAGSTDTYYRLPQNVASLRQMYDITVEPGRLYESSAALLNATQDALKFNLNFGGQLVDVSGRTGLTQSEIVHGIVTQSIADDQSRTYASVDTNINTAQITLKDPRSLQTSTTFLSRVMELPYSNFSYSKYIELIQDFGTHYVSSGKLGGNFKDIEVHSRCWLDSSSFEDYTSVSWREVLKDCSRQSFFNRLNPDTNALSSHCTLSSNSGGTTKTLRQEAVDYYISASGGAIDTSSDLKFSFSKTTWDAWIKTIVNSPTINTKDFTLGKLSKLVWSPTILMNSDRKQQVADYIDQAIEIYLKPYDAQTHCQPCAPIDTETVDYDENGDEISVFSYGVPYLTGTGEDYKCHCIYDMPRLEETCGAMQNLATLCTVLMSILAAYWNLHDH